MRVTATAEHYREVVVHAAMDGDYNESGLPNPLVPTHDFTMRDDRIVRVVIIRNEHTEAS
jgi:hypothetical protein